LKDLCCAIERTFGIESGMPAFLFIANYVSYLVFSATSVKCKYLPRKPIKPFLLLFISLYFVFKSFLTLYFSQVHTMAMLFKL
jgi:hypothetical protein